MGRKFAADDVCLDPVKLLLIVLLLVFQEHDHDIVLGALLLLDCLQALDLYMVELGTQLAFPKERS